MAVSPLLGAPSPLFSRPDRTTSPLSGRTFASPEDLGKTLNAYRDQVTAKYRTLFSGEGKAGKVSVDDLKDLIRQQFPGYTWSDGNPADVTRGKNLLHIDDANLRKMADDADYRARVFGLMDTELQGTSALRMRSPLGSVSTMRTAGSVFSIDDANPSEDGIPYVGMAIGEGVDDGSDGEGGDEPSLLDALPKIRTDAATLGSADWYRQWLEKAAKQAGSATASTTAANPKGPTGGKLDLIV